jgi:hypothetical protein
MNTNNISRRQLILTAAGAGLGVLVANRASGQNEPDIGLSALDAGKLHQEGMNKIANILGPTSAGTKEGMLKIVKYLQDNGLIDEKQAAIIADVINAVFDSVNADKLPDLEKMYVEIQKICERAGKAADDLAVAIASIARESVTYAKEHLRDLDSKTVRDLISSDVDGGMWGATIGARLGPRFKIAGAAIGAIGSSGWEAFRRPK